MSVEKTKNGKTWPATQVGLRPVEAGLGGHDAGVWGVDEGVKNASSPIPKRGRYALSDCVTLQWVERVEKENVSMKKFSTAYL